MILRQDKNALRRQRAKRTSDIHGTKERPRLVVYRSLGEMYAQIVNDDKGETLVAVNTMQEEIKKLIKNKTKCEASTIVGEQIGKAALAKKIKKVVFDRNGYVYAGRIAKVADGARKAGLDF